MSGSQHGAGAAEWIEEVICQDQFLEIRNDREGKSQRKKGRVGYMAFISQEGLI